MNLIYGLGSLFDCNEANLVELMSDFSCIVRAILPAQKGQLSSQLMHNFAQSTMSNVFFQSLFRPLFDKNETSENGRRKWGRFENLKHLCGYSLVLKRFALAIHLTLPSTTHSTESADEIYQFLPKLADVKLVLL